MPIQPSQPRPQEATPYAPEAIEPLVFDTFAGINTSTLRVGVPDEQAYWIDGFMPIDRRNARTLYDLGPTLYTAVSVTVVFFEFYNLLGIPYMVVFLSDGSVVQVNVNTQAVTTILLPGTIGLPNILNVGVSQWAQQFLIIVANQTNGYWVWDGRTIYTAGTLAPIVTITNAGSGYATPPAVIATGGNGMGASFQANVSNGFLTSIAVISAGSGYVAGNSISLTLLGGTVSGSGASVVGFLGSPVSGSGASFLANMANFGAYDGVISVAIVSPGSGYSAYTYLFVNIAATNFYEVPILQAVISGGSVTGVNVLFSGQSTSGLAPFVTAIDPGARMLTSTSIVAAGSGYSPNASIVATGGSSPNPEANLSPILVNGSIASVVITSGGNYGGATPPALSITDSPSLAAAMVSLMPFGISGTSVETYVGYVWVVNGNVLYNSAPGSVSDFATSDGGGNKTSNSSQLRVGYKRLKAANGFLYTIADSSIDVVSGVQTSGSLITTSYSWLNVDPETGSPYPESVMTWDRGIMLMNAFGIHVLEGSSVRKISTPLDGVFNTVPNFAGQQLSIAEHILYGRKCAVALVPIIDPVKNTQVNKLLCFDGKRWFASEQGRTLTYIKHQEINSSITCYGTDGTVVAPLFTTPAVTFAKTIQSKLWDNPGGYQYGKGVSRFWSLWNYNSSVSTSLVVNIDSLNNLNAYSRAIYTIAGPTVTGYFATPAQAVGQQGVLVGMTLTTRCPDVQLASAVIQPELEQYRG